jgi:hypothetical protein
MRLAGFYGLEGVKFLAQESVTARHFTKWLDLPTDMYHLEAQTKE